MKTRKQFFIALLATVIGTTAVLAGSGWHKIGSFTAGGEPKEVAVNRNCSTCLVKVTDGSVIINTVVVRQGDGKNPITVGQRIEAGNQREISVGNKVYVTGFRISDDGRGSYDVYVK